MSNIQQLHVMGFGPRITQLLSAAELTEFLLATVRCTFAEVGHKSKLALSIKKPERGRHEMYSNATVVRIQAAARGRATRRLTESKVNAAVKIQSIIRGRIARKPSTSRCDEAAARIQAAVRGRAVRRKVQSETNAVVKIQSATRGSQTRKDLAIRQASATRIQAVYRGQRTRCTVMW